MRVGGGEGGREPAFGVGAEGGGEGEGGGSAWGGGHFFLVVVEGREGDVGMRWVGCGGLSLMSGGMDGGREVWQVCRVLGAD